MAPDPDLAGRRDDRGEAVDPHVIADRDVLNADDRAVARDGAVLAHPRKAHLPQLGADVIAGVERVLHAAHDAPGGARLSSRVAA
jgi:hypothetical protein